jgi:hypothetical protein
MVPKFRGAAMRRRDFIRVVIAAVAAWLGLIAPPALLARADR